ncbi:hypothetical protein CJF30_00001142 [Rutstroemia sp. NJR-2017a BBW]|nr:hypothetical protein CJF30_00001142 [Rutstroemia sp. NJR-2017a BBW]
MSSDTQSIQGFPRFSALPQELQNMIWEEVCNIPSILECREDDLYPLIPLAYELQYKIPSVLHTCVNARKIALQRYKLIGPNDIYDPEWPRFARFQPKLFLRESATEDNPTKLYVNYSVDIMVCYDWAEYWTPAHPWLTDEEQQRNMSISPGRTFCENLQHIVVTDMALLVYSNEAKYLGRLGQIDDYDSSLPAAITMDLLLEATDTRIQGSLREAERARGWNFQFRYYFHKSVGQSHKDTQG